MTAPEWTAIPEVRAALVDTILPAAVAALPTSITSGGRTWPLRAPDVYYGDPPDGARPQSVIIVGPAGDLAQDYKGLRDAPGSRRETFGLLVRVWYAIGDQSQEAQRAATESSWAIYRAIQAAARDTDPDPWSFLTQPTRALFTSVVDRDFYTDNGRASQLDLTLEIESRV